MPNEDDERGGGGLGLLLLLGAVVGGGALALWYFSNKAKATPPTPPIVTVCNPDGTNCQVLGAVCDQTQPYNQCPTPPEGYFRECGTTEGGVKGCILKKGADRQSQCQTDAGCIPQVTGSHRECINRSCGSVNNIEGYLEDRCYNDLSCIGTGPSDKHPTYIYIEGLSTPTAPSAGLTMDYAGRTWINCGQGPKYLPYWRSAYYTVAVLDMNMKPMPDVYVSITQDSNKWVGKRVWYAGLETTIVCGDVYARTDENGRIKFQLIAIRKPSGMASTRMTFQVEKYILRDKDGNRIDEVILNAPKPIAVISLLGTGGVGDIFGDTATVDGACEQMSGCEK